MFLLFLLFPDIFFKKKKGKSGNELFGVFFVLFFVVLGLLVGVFTVLSYPVRWHLICLTLFFSRLFCFFSLYHKSMTTEFVQMSLG